MEMVFTGEEDGREVGKRGGGRERGSEQTRIFRKEIFYQKKTTTLKCKNFLTKIRLAEQAGSELTAQ